MAQGTEFPLRKPAGFHWDLFLLGLTTGVGGITPMKAQMDTANAISRPPRHTFP